jgi:hypothetical protein
MLSDQDKAHIEALCAQLERTQVEIGLLLHNARTTLRNVTAVASKLADERNAVQVNETGPEPPALLNRKQRRALAAELAKG